MSISKQAIGYGIIGIIIGAIVTGLVFYFCPTKQDYRQQEDQKVMQEDKKTDPKPVTDKTSVIVPKPTSTAVNIEIYKQWAYPASEKVLVEQFNKVDTVAVEYPEYSSGDLLSSLIVGGKNLFTYGEGKINLAAYTREYLVSLERDFARYTQTNKKGDFYAAYVTHLSDGIDVASGQVGRERFNMSGVALVRVNGKVYELENPPRIFNQSATGAGVYSCEASLKNKEILWTCFEGFAANDEEGITGSQLSETRYSLTGKKLGTREYAE